MNVLDIGAPKPFIKAMIKVDLRPSMQKGMLTRLQQAADIPRVKEISGIEVIRGFSVFNYRQRVGLL